jgi:UDP-glucuronate 4-epimerase
MYKVFITSATGFIGFHLSKSLLDDYKVLGIDNINDYYDPKLDNARLDQLILYNNFTFKKINKEIK